MKEKRKRRRERYVNNDFVRNTMGLYGLLWISMNFGLLYGE